MPIARNYLANVANSFTGTTLRVGAERHTIGNESVIQEHIEAGITLVNAVNFLVEKYELARIDRRVFSWLEPSPYLRAVDILRARRDTGLLRGCNHTVAP